MDSKLIEVYNDLLDQGISIMDLYIYDYLINNAYTNENIEDLFNRVVESYNNDNEYRDLHYHLNAVINGETEYDEEWD